MAASSPPAASRISRMTSWHRRIGWNRESLTALLSHRSRRRAPGPDQPCGSSAMRRPLQDRHAGGGVGGYRDHLAKVGMTLSQLGEPPRDWPASRGPPEPPRSLRRQTRFRWSPLERVVHQAPAAGVPPRRRRVEPRSRLGSPPRPMTSSTISWSRATTRTRWQPRAEIRLAPAWSAFAADPGAASAGNPARAYGAGPPQQLVGETGDDRDAEQA